jgi:hypothetical protein
MTAFCSIHKDVKLSKRGSGHVEIFFCSVCFPKLKTLECYGETNQ